MVNSHPGDIPLAEWNNLVSGYLSKEGANKSIYANGIGEVRVFSSVSEASAAGFAERLSITKIISISINRLKASTNDKELAVGNRLLMELIQRKISKINNPSVKERFLRTILSSRLDEQLESLKQSKRSVLPHLDIISPEMTADFLRSFSQANRLIRSKQGQDGVYFIDTPVEAASFVIKSVIDPLKTVIADRYYSLFGFKVSEYSPIYFDSELGKQVMQRIKGEALTYESSRNQDSAFTPQKLKESFTSRLEENKYILASRIIRGTSFVQLSIDDIVDALKNEMILKTIGRMIFLDVFINNSDRFMLKFNFGNFLLLPEDKSGSQLDYLPIALIDHSYQIENEEKAKTAIGNLESYLKNPRLLKEQVGSFIEAMLGRGELSKEIKDQIKKEAFDPILAGFMQAKNDLLSHFSDGQTVNQLFDVEGVVDSAKLDKNLFKEMIGLVRSWEK